MKIYTKGGDLGQTQVYLSEAKRLSKDNLILNTYGDIDELNSHIGLLLAKLKEQENKLDTSLINSLSLSDIQHDLFKIGFAISDTPQLADERVNYLEGAIDQLQAEIAPQTHFILPGGSAVASQAHVCRTVARRAERTLVALHNEHEVPGVCLRYLNRLSDFLFVFARYLNALAGQPDIEI